MAGIIKTHSGVGQLYDEDQFFCRGEYRITVAERRDGRYRITGEFTVDETESMKPEVLNSSRSIKVLHLKDGRTLRCWLNQIDPLAGRYELVAAPGNTDEQIRKLTQ